MKYLLSILFLLIIASCTSVRYVDVERRYTYRHRPNVHIVPVWVPGRGVMLQQQHWYQPRPKRIPRKH